METKTSIKWAKAVLNHSSHFYGLSEMQERFYLTGLYQKVVNDATLDRLAGKWDGKSLYGEWQWDIPELIEILGGDK